MMSSPEATTVYFAKLEALKDIRYGFTAFSFVGRIYILQ